MTTTSVLSLFNSIPKFDGTNWVSFKKDVEVYFILEGNWGIVSGDTAKPADAAFLYSNLGFGLLGYGLSQRAGVPYGELLASEIVGPLHLSDTGLTLSPGVDATLPWLTALFGGRQFARTWHFALMVLVPTASAEANPPAPMVAVAVVPELHVTEDVTFCVLLSL